MKVALQADLQVREGTADPYPRRQERRIETEQTGLRRAVESQPLAAENTRDGGCAARTRICRIVQQFIIHELGVLMVLLGFDLRACRKHNYKE